MSDEFRVSSEWQKPGRRDFHGQGRSGRNIVNEPTPDYAWTTREGHEVRVRTEGESVATFEFHDGSTLTVTEDANGEREYRVSPWPPVELEES